MNKRLEKRHKRQVSRARARVKLSEPDVRTHEQIEAAREASRPDLSRGNAPKIADTGRSFRNRLATSTGSGAKTDG